MIPRHLSTAGEECSRVSRFGASSTHMWKSMNKSLEVGQLECMPQKGLRRVAHGCRVGMRMLSQTRICCTKHGG
eukprot:337739-Amphidinium_carterae.1